MTNKLIVPVAVLTLIVGSGLAIKKVSAVNDTGPQTSLIQKLVSRFGLKESEVKEVFDEARTERQTAMRNRFEERLTQAVTDQKITEAQKKLIIDKQNELAAKRNVSAESFTTMTPEQRRAAILKEQADLKSWADGNGINLQYFRSWGMRGMKGWAMGKGNGDLKGD